jgi:hypothetical protein
MVNGDSLDANTSYIHLTQGPLELPQLFSNSKLKIPVVLNTNKDVHLVDIL